MSYCRWSCDNGRSDVYSYESADNGYVVHVAGRRRVGEWPDVPPLPPIGAPSSERRAWVEARKARDVAMAACPFEDITLPHAGESFFEPSLQALHNRLSELRALGYHVPDHAFVAIEEEINLQTEVLD